jgi:hypothetical protein
MILSYFKPDSSGKFFLKRCKNAEGIEYFQEIGENIPEGADIENYVRVSKFFKKDYMKLQVFCLPGLPLLDIFCVLRIEPKKIWFSILDKFFVSDVDISVYVEDKSIRFSLIGRFINCFYGILISTLLMTTLTWLQ